MSEEKWRPEIVLDNGSNEKETERVKMQGGKKAGGGVAEAK